MSRNRTQSPRWLKGPKSEVVKELLVINLFYFIYFNLCNDTEPFWHRKGKGGVAVPWYPGWDITENWLTECLCDVPVVEPGLPASHRVPARRLLLLLLQSRSILSSIGKLIKSYLQWLSLSSSLYKGQQNIKKNRIEISFCNSSFTTSLYEEGEYYERLPNIKF